MNSDVLVVEVIIEIERHSNLKWEYDRNSDSLFLDRVLQYPYFYPYAYGFFPNTLGNDGDELDVLLITEKNYPNYNSSKTRVRVCIVGGLMMCDEKGADEKIFVVPEDEKDAYFAKTANEKALIENNIIWFFTNYKKNDLGKWSRVESLLSLEQAVEIYNSAKLAFLENSIV